MSTTATRPQAPAVIPGNIPHELTASPRWVVWRYKLEDNKWRKPPVNCRTGRGVGPTNRDALAPFADALAYYRTGRADGIGFVFRPEDPYAGVDLDACRDPGSGALQPWARDTVRDLDSYAEISPSGTGVKVIVRGKLPCGAARGGRIEVYSQAHYFALTGLHLPGSPRAVEDRQAQLLLVQLAAIDPAVASPDHQVLRTALQAKNGDKFARLWAGDTAGYDSDSEADLALCGMLAYWLGDDADAGRVERLFGLSALARRTKWGRLDYRQRTIDKALAGRPRAGLTRTNHPTRSRQDEPRPLNTGTAGLPEAALSPAQGREAVEVAPALADEEGQQAVLTRTKHPTRSRQDEPRLLNTDAAGLPEAALSPAQEREAVEVAAALADEEGQREDWQVMFTLARRLRARLAGDGGRAEPFRRAVIAFCARAGRPAEDYWYTFRLCWGKVKLAEGEDVLAWAANMARKQPYLPACPLQEKYAFVAALAWHLAEFRRPEAFWLPLRPLADLLNTTAMTVSRVIDLLEQDGVVRCVDGDYSYTRRKAKEYVFTGPPPAARPDAAA